MKSTLKMMSLCAAAAALTAMGVVTVQHSSAGVGGSPAVVATGNSSSGPATTSTVPKAGPAVKATTFAGGDWPGMGSFGEDWQK